MTEKLILASLMHEIEIPHFLKKYFPFLKPLWLPPVPPPPHGAAFDYKSGKVLDSLISIHTAVCHTWSHFLSWDPIV